MSLVSILFPSCKRFAAFLALWAMLVPVGTSLVHHPQASMQSLVHICGMAPSSGGAANKIPPTHKLPACPICQSMHLLAGGFVPPDIPFLIFLAVIPSLYRLTETAFVLEFFAPHQGQPRAPPSLV